jgi:IclR family pca regulon transcriptional regulator
MYEKYFAIRKKSRERMATRERMAKRGGPKPTRAGAGAKASPSRRGGVPPPTTDERSVVQSLAKGLRILECFSADRMEMTLSEVAAAGGLDPGTTFRMLNTLVMLGYVTRVPGTKRFRLTLKAADLGLHAIGHADLREIARPILRSLVGEVNEAASLGVLDGGDVLYIERVRAGLTRIGVDIRIGTTIPAVCSAIGQVMLAYLPERDAERVIASAPRPGTMPVVTVSRADLDRSLAEIRRLGYALRDSYFGSGLRVLAVPVLDIDGYPLAALSVAAPAVRATPAEFEKSALAPVRSAAREIARAVQVGGTITASA